MQLISASASPFVRKVRVLLHETDQIDDVELLDVTTTPVTTDPAVAAANPVGKIPALIRPDSPAIYDSRVICRYLDARGSAGLYPEARLWDTLTIEATADGIMDAAVLVVYESRVRPVEKVYEGWMDAQWGKVMRSVQALNTRWMSHLNGPLDMGQIAVGCGLGYLDFRHASRGWRQGNDTLANWYEAFAQRESMRSTEPQD